MNTETHSDFVIVGSGINSLMCAAILAKSGASVRVLERSDTLGGCVFTEELTLPGFKHDGFATFCPLLVASTGFSELRADLEGYGLEFVSPKFPTAGVLPDQRHFVFGASREENVRRIRALSDEDAKHYAATLAELDSLAPFIYGLMESQLWRSGAVKIIAKQFFKSGLKGLTSFFGEALQSGRSWLNDDFDSDLLHATFAPWALHAGFGPDEASSGLLNRMIVHTLEGVGMPLVKGGIGNLVGAFKQLIEQRGGSFVTGADVVRVITNNGGATGVETATQGNFTAAKAVICNVTPTQLYGRLLTRDDAPAEITEQAQAYRYGRADMQIHIALDAPVHWADPELDEVAMVHVTDGLDGVSAAVNQSLRGLLPASSSIAIAQPTRFDPTRAPAGKGTLWMQLLEVPGVVKGDAKNEIPVTAAGWTEDVKEQFADRIIDQLTPHLPDLKQKILKRVVFSPADLEARNINLVGGDPYSGACSLDQFVLWRPLRGLKNHATPVKRLFHIGGSTHPGAGLGAGSGYLVGKQLS